MQGAAVVHLGEAEQLTVPYIALIDSDGRSSLAVTPVMHSPPGLHRHKSYVVQSRKSCAV